MSQNHGSNVVVDVEAAKLLAGPVQAPKVDAMAEIVEVADDVRKNAIVRMTEAWKAVAVAEESLVKGLIGDAVAAIVGVLALPTTIRPKYAKIAELILSAMGRSVHGSTVVKLPDGTEEVRTSKVNAYRQYATPYVTLARWEAGLFNKAETEYLNAHPSVKRQIVYKNEVYTSPVAALKSGVPAITAFRSFRNVFQTKVADLGDLHGSKSESLGKDHAKKISVPYRVTNDEGKVVKTRTKVAGNQSMTVGMILGLLGEFKAPFSQQSFDKLTAAVAKVAPAPAPSK